MNTPNPPTPLPSLYASAGFVMIRMPLLPIETLRAWLELPLESPALFPIADGHPVSLGDALKRDTLAIREHLRAMIADPVVQEAILTGSPDLFQAIPRWLQAPDSRKGRQAQAHLLRYLVRMTTRPTPFGLFAGVALGQIGPAMDLSVGPLAHNTKRTRPDMQWLLYLIRELEQRPEVIAHLRFFTNPVTFISGGRLYLPHYDSYGQAEADRTVSLRATPVVLRVLALAREGTTLDSLKQQLLVERPNATEGQVEELLERLRQQGALLSDLRPPLTHTDAICYVLNRIEGIPRCDDIRQQLRTVRTLAETYDAQPIGQGIAAYQALYAATAVSDSNIHSTLEVDMATACDACTFSAQVADELARAAETMLRISTHGPRYPHLAAYRTEFRERYSEGREVPLLELLDEDIGLGPPATYQKPPRVGESPPPSPQQYPVRDRRLLELAATALRANQREVVLDEADIRQLQTHDSWQTLIPDSLELYVSIAAPSQAALNNGTFLAVIGPRIGDQPAGRSFGRFCDILGAAAGAALTRMAREEEARAPGRIFAELVYLPTRGHAANVAIRPTIRQYEVVVAAAPGVAYADTVPMDDLVVGIRSDRFYLRSVSRDVEVVITSTHLLNYMQAPNVCRFLAEVAAEGVMRIYGFDWGAAAPLPFLPRVRVGRTVLHPAQWRLPSALMTTDIAAHDEVGWYQQLQEWRRMWDVPRFVYLTDADNRLLLDLENPLCVADLSDECRKRAGGRTTIVLQEMLPGFEELWSAGVDGSYLLEFIVPLQRCDPPIHPAPSVRRGVVASSDRLCLPGSDWLYAKLYSGRTRHDDLVGGPLRDFTEHVLRSGLAERWFFIRYADPEPHLRLRLQGEPGQLLAALLPALTAWNQSLVATGLVRKLVLDSYDREVERYGGPTGVKTAEAIFAADSRAVAAIIALRLQRTLELTPVDLALLTVDDLVTSLGIMPAERLGLYRAMRESQGRTFESQLDRLHKVFHGYRKTAQRIVGDRAWLRDQPGGAALEELLHDRAKALRVLGEQYTDLAAREQLWVSPMAFLSSCVHMHCNRLLGTNRMLEFEIIYDLERTLDSLERYTPPSFRIG